VEVSNDEDEAGGHGYCREIFGGLGGLGYSHGREYALGHLESSYAAL
jgi:hypothetical protein